MLAAGTARRGARPEVSTNAHNNCFARKHSHAAAHANAKGELLILAGLSKQSTFLELFCKFRGLS